MRQAAHVMEPSFEYAAQLFQQGRLSEALNACSTLLRAQPRHAGALHLLGVLALHAGETDTSIGYLQKSLEVDPRQSDVLCTLSAVLLQLNRATEAFDCTERALQLAPSDHRVLNAHGNSLMALSRTTQALTIFTAICRQDPTYAKAFNNLGNALTILGRIPDALSAYEHAWSLNARDSDVACNRATALLSLGRLRDALVAAEQAIAIEPRLPSAHFIRGNILLDQGRPADALGSYDTAVALHPTSPEFHRNRGKALLDLDRPADALASLDRAIQLRADYAGARVNRGNALLRLGRVEEAVAAYREVLDLDPGNAEALSNLTSALLGGDTGDTHERLERFAQSAGKMDFAQGSVLQAQMQSLVWSRYPQLTRQLFDSVADGQRATAPLWLLSHSDSASLQLQCARAYAAGAFAGVGASRSGKRYGHEKIRVAYVSADFRAHAMSLLMAGVFEQHDRDGFEIIAVSLNPAQDSEIGRRVKQAMPRFHDLSACSDAQIAQFIRENEVDIAVDLMGFTSGARTGVFARRPAPVQVNYLGYPGTMGADFIDYLLADEFVIPSDRIQHYTEKVVHLPVCFQANDERRPRDQHRFARSQFGLPPDSLVLCSFNNSVKINPPVFDIWCRILQASGNTVLWLLADTAVSRQTLRREAQSRGVDPERLVFAGRAGYEDYLARMELADLFLDTFPFNGGTTSSDALWTGLPVLTCAGDAFASRMSGSLLSALQLPELITYSLQEYESCALDLLRHPLKLAAIRARLRANRETNGVFQAELCCRRLEAAFRTMWLRHERGESPAAFSVPAR
jgi:protein O-GlcNAc transferase